MTKQNNLFLATFDALHKSGVFEDIILIGSWCHYFYTDEENRQIYSVISFKE
jgi:hypothetical protein